MDHSADKSPPEQQLSEVHALLATGRSTRKPPLARKKELLSRAIEYFSEAGFDGGTRALARRIGITQPLIYRYFPSKDDLINEVYHAVYVSQWNDDWTTQLCDRGIPLKQRLNNFYHDYSRVVFNRTWMRIFFFAGLKGLDINTRYIERVISNLLMPICRECRAHLGIATDQPITEAELELVWLMHGGIFYQGIREHVYGLPENIDHDRTARSAISMYLNLATTAVPDAIAGLSTGQTT